MADMMSAIENTEDSKPKTRLEERLVPQLVSHSETGGVADQRRRYASAA